MLERSLAQEIRDPAVAGRFYPAEAGALERDVRRFLAASEPAAEVSAQMVMAPHAGYQYSGAIAGSTYGRVKAFSRAIVLGPNHTGLGARRSVTTAASWALPGGGIIVDVELRDRLIELAALEADRMAHLREHAVEVQLPFLRAKSPGASFVAVCLAGLSFSECRRLGEGIAAAVRAASPDAPKDVLLVASTDMSHYVPADVARRLDALAIERVVALDPEALYRVVRDRDISMCGYVPTAVALVAALALGATRAELVSYGNSGETSGDTDRVVGYAGAAVS